MRLCSCSQCAGNLWSSGPFVDKLGRRKLLIIASVWMFVTQVSPAGSQLKGLISQQEPILLLPMAALTADPV